MPALGLVGIVLVLLLVLAALAPRVFAAAPPAKDAPPAAAAPAKPGPEAKASPLTQQELQEKLSKLARSAPPTKLAPAAMCYEPVAQPATADYVCPVDGSRTQYPRQSGMVDLVRGLPGLRQAAKSLPGLDASLDEKQLCRKCSPKGQGGVALVVRYPDGREVRTEGVTGLDLKLLSEFLSGSDKHQGDYGNESPLKDQLPRIRALLGMPEK